MAEILFLAFLAGFSTCLGAAAVLAWGRPGRRLFSLLLGLAAGVMLAVVALDLLPEAFSYGGPGRTLTGFAAGLLLMHALDLFLNGEAAAAPPGFLYLKMGYLIAAGIALHDLPEGLAIAAGFARPGSTGPLLVLAIALHNIPEGMATAAPLFTGGLSPRRVLALNGLVSLVTPAGCWLGLFMLQALPGYLPLLLAAAAGAMTYVVAQKLLPACAALSPPFAAAGCGGGFLLVAALNLLL